MKYRVHTDITLYTWVHAETPEEAQNVVHDILEKDLRVPFEWTGFKNTHVEEIQE